MEEILVVDDEKEIADLVEVYLQNEGYRVHKFCNAGDALACLSQNKVSLALLDVMLPDMDGLTLLQEIRKTYLFPIIMLTAKVEDMDKIKGLTLGADDYITKPFNPLEVMARVKTQLRRYKRYNVSKNAALEAEQETREAAEYDIRNLHISRDNHKVTLNGKHVQLTPIEFDILYLLASNPGKVFSTDEIFERVWNEKMYEANNTVMVHIRRLREKIEMDPKNAEIIKTVWGVGYRIER